MRAGFLLVMMGCLGVSCTVTRECGKVCGSLCGKAEGKHGSAGLHQEEVDGVMRSVLRVDRIEAGTVVADSLKVSRILVKESGIRSSSGWTSEYSNETTIDRHGVQLVLEEMGKRRSDGTEFKYESGIGLSFFHGAPVIEMRRGKKEVTIAWEDDGLYQYVDGKPKVKLMKVDW